jgi:hypothetical protein
MESNQSLSPTTSNPVKANALPEPPSVNTNVFLSDTYDNRHHPELFYASHLQNELIHIFIIIIFT